jgi:hypothetical protein
MFTRKDDLVQVAALAKILVRDELLRSKIIKAQRQRREYFTQVVTKASLRELISKMEETYIKSAEKYQ